MPKEVVKVEGKIGEVDWEKVFSDEDHPCRTCENANKDLECSHSQIQVENNIKVWNWEIFCGLYNRRL
jgi:hypothetical protein